MKEVYVGSRIRLTKMPSETILEVLRVDSVRVGMVGSVLHVYPNDLYWIELEDLQGKAVAFAVLNSEEFELEEKVELIAKR